MERPLLQARSLYQRLRLTEAGTVALLLIELTRLLPIFASVVIKSPISVEVILLLLLVAFPPIEYHFKVQAAMLHQSQLLSEMERTRKMEKPKDSARRQSNKKSFSPSFFKSYLMFCKTKSPFQTADGYFPCESRSEAMGGTPTCLITPEAGEIAKTLSLVILVHEVLHAC